METSPQKWPILFRYPTLPNLCCWMVSRIASEASDWTMCGSSSFLVPWSAWENMEMWGHGWGFAVKGFGSFHVPRLGDKWEDVGCRVWSQVPHILCLDFWHQLIQLVAWQEKLRRVLGRWRRWEDDSNSSTWIVEPILSGHSVKEGVTKFKTAKPPNHWIDRINHFVFFEYFACTCCTFQACPFHLVKALFWFSTQVGTHLHQPSLPSSVHQVPSRICPRLFGLARLEASATCIQRIVFGVGTTCPLGEFGRGNPRANRSVSPWRLL